MEILKGYERYGPMLKARDPAQQRRPQAWQFPHI